MHMYISWMLCHDLEKVKFKEWIRKKYKFNFLYLIPSVKEFHLWETEDTNCKFKKMPRKQILQIEKFDTFYSFKYNYLNLMKQHECVMIKTCSNIVRIQFLNILLNKNRLTKN